MPKIFCSSEGGGLPKKALSPAVLSPEEWAMPLTPWPQLPGWGEPCLSEMAGLLASLLSCTRLRANASLLRPSYQDRGVDEVMGLLGLPTRPSIQPS